jgi:hypothetical protein
MSHPNSGVGSGKSRLAKAAASLAFAFSAVTGCLLASALGASAQAVPPFGPSKPNQNKNIFYFMPWGAQLDGDNTFPVYHVPDTSIPTNISYNIYDIAIGADTPLDFDVYLYTTAPQYVNNKALHSFDFLAEFDDAEYKFNNFVPNDAIISNCPLVPGVGAMVGLLDCNFKAGVAVAQGAFAAPVKLGTVKGVTVKPGFFPHDGLADFKLTLKEILYIPGNPPVVRVEGITDQFQDVELQSAPAPLPILGAAAAFGSVRKARRFAAQLKTLSIG